MRAERVAFLAAGVFLATCLPALVALRLAAVVAAYWLLLSFLMAAAGMYRSPVALGP